MAGVVFSKNFFTLIFTPYPFVKTSKLYFLFDLVINPLVVVVMTGLFIREIMVYQRDIVKELEFSEESYMFKCVRLTRIKVTCSEELKKELDTVMLDGKDRNLTLVKDCYMMEQNFDDFFSYNIMYNVTKDVELP